MFFVVLLIKKKTQFINLKKKSIVSLLLSFHQQHWIETNFLTNLFHFLIKYHLKKYNNDQLIVSVCLKLELIEIENFYHKLVEIIINKFEERKRRTAVLYNLSKPAGQIVIAIISTTIMRSSTLKYFYFT